MKFLIILACVLAACSAHPGHFPKSSLKLDRFGPLAISRMAVHSGTGIKEQYDLDEVPDIPDINKDLSLQEGDIMLKRDSRNTIHSTTYADYFWTNKTVPIRYESSTTLLTKAAVDEARREYELRTCISMPERTDEENFITFRKLSGCWSYIGMNGGPQNISIGPGCERMSTVVHELMHALGIWHEQSRADRDDYVEIQYEYISEGREHNFNNYDFNLTDDRRVPYDYNSVMHYSKTAFSKDGNITIRTRDDYFQDEIGQRGTFSAEDSTKIDRMYDCSDTIRISHTVNFHEQNLGGYTQVNLGSDVDWLRHNAETSDASGATTRYLPKFDSTYGIEGIGDYIYLDTTNRMPGMAGIIKSMRYTTTVARQCLEFSYYIKVASNAIMTVYVASLNPLTGEIDSYGQPLQTFSGDYGNEWNVQRMTIEAPSSYRIVFYAKTGGYPSDVIAIDDVSVLDRECDTANFLIPDFTEKMNTYAVDQFVQSPTMYTGTPGYAFQVLFYPNGSQSAVDAGYTNYMSYQFRLVGGKYDEQMEWPFDKQFVRLLITDQDPNPLTRLNRYYNFLTDKESSLNASWEKPTGLDQPNTPVGYRTFMPKEMVKTKRYLKHDVAYLSVQVADMRPYEGSTEISAKLRNPVIRTRADLSIQHYVEDQESDLIVDVTDGNDGMISVKSAILVTVLTTGLVFIVMSITICVVASSYRRTLRHEAIMHNNIRYMQPKPGSTIKFTSSSGRL